MRCFRHPTNDAVGVCKNCGRGVCPQCAAEVDDSLACKGRCEEKVAEVNQLLKGAPDARRSTALTHRRSGTTAIASGLLFAAMGAMFIKVGHNDFSTTLGYIFVALGSVYALNGLLVIRTASRFDFPAADAGSERQRKSDYEHFGR
ncbi:MAG TPA: hypothetical protein VF175_10710 [Lacipirellula sp.]